MSDNNKTSTVKTNTAKSNRNDLIAQADATELKAQPLAANSSSAGQPKAAAETEKVSTVVEAGQVSHVKAEPGSSFKVFKRNSKVEDELLDQVIASQHGNDLVITYDNGTVVQIDGFYQTGASSTVSLPDQNGAIKLYSMKYTTILNENLDLPCDNVLPTIIANNNNKYKIAVRNKIDSVFT